MLATAGLAPPALLGRRGYFRDTMGAVGENDIGVYDDAMFVVTPGAYRTFNANVDPSRQKPGMATLAAGTWRYKLGIHNISKAPERRYPALIQAAPVTVSRFGGGLTASVTGWFGINIHRGGDTTTSSAGCVTIHPSQWDEFYKLVSSSMSYYGLDTINFLLTARRAGDPI